MSCDPFTLMILLFFFYYYNHSHLFFNMEDFWDSNENDIYLNQLPLEVDYYGSTSIFGVIVSATLRGNSTTIDVAM